MAMLHCNVHMVPHIFPVMVPAHRVVHKLLLWDRLQTLVCKNDNGSSLEGIWNDVWNLS